MSLHHGERYSVKVEAVNQRDEIVSAISDGFAVDRTAPSAGSLKIGHPHGQRRFIFPETRPPLRLGQCTIGKAL